MPHVTIPALPIEIFVPTEAVISVVDISDDRFYSLLPSSTVFG
jgi:hypothetical protein